MTVLRFVQNFRQRHALILSSDLRAIQSLAPTLGKLGLSVEHLPCGDEQPPVLREGLDADRHVLFVDGDLHQPPCLPLCAHAGLPPLPVIGLVGVEAPSRLRNLMQSGATAFLPKPVHGGSVFSALYLAVNEYARKAEMHAANSELENRRRMRRHVIKAVVMVMRARNLDDDAAFASLRKDAMRARVSLETYCQYVVQRRATEHVSSPAAKRQVCAD